MPRALILCVFVTLLLAGCQTTTRSIAEKPILAKIPLSLRLACPGVVAIPDRDLTQAEVARLWAHDRSALGECVRRHAALAKSAAALEGQGK